MTPLKLTRDLIEDTSAMRLILRISERCLSAVIAGEPSPERTVLTHSEELANKSVKALEDAVYDNPLLLGDFERIDIILEGHDIFAAPKECAGLHDAMADAMLPDSDSARVILTFDAGEADLCCAVDADLYNFLARTFSYAVFHHSLALEAVRHDSPGLYAACDEECGMNLVRVDRDGKLACLNRPQTWSPADCAYYIAATYRAGDDIYLSAEPDDRERIFDLLRKVLPDVKVLPLEQYEDYQL